MAAIDTDIRKTLIALRQPDALANRLRSENVNRVFVMGCGRSGTFLLTSTMATFRNVGVFYSEVPVEYFGIINKHHDTIVLKRAANSYETIEQIPSEISIVYIVRHPFDILTSIHPTARLKTGRYYHITPGRWLGETMALRWLVESNRLRTKIVRYEDLVRDPNRVQAELGSFLDLEIETKASDFHNVCSPPPMAIQAMNGLRPFDGKSIGRWQSDPEAINYLRSIRFRLSECLPWIGRTFDYDITMN